MQINHSLIFNSSQYNIQLSVTVKVTLWMQLPALCNVSDVISLVPTQKTYSVRSTLIHLRIREIDLPFPFLLCTSGTSYKNRTCLQPCPSLCTSPKSGIMYLQNMFFPTYLWMVFQSIQFTLVEDTFPFTFLQNYQTTTKKFHIIPWWNKRKKTPNIPELQINPFKSRRNFPSLFLSQVQVK